MAKKLIRSLMPDPGLIRQNRYLKVFGSRLHRPNLWYLNRRSAAGAFAIGFFSMFMPIPFQMLLAAGLAMAFSVNLPLSVSLVWISNPVTMGPMLYGSYRLGVWMLNCELFDFHFEPSVGAIIELGRHTGPALLAGSLLCGIISAAAGYMLLRGLWRLSVSLDWRKRSERFIKARCTKLSRIEA